MGLGQEQPWFALKNRGFEAPRIVLICGHRGFGDLGRAIDDGPFEECGGRGTIQFESHRQGLRRWSLSNQATHITQNRERAAAECEGLAILVTRGLVNLATDILKE